MCRERNRSRKQRRRKEIIVDKGISQTAKVSIVDLSCLAFFDSKENGGKV